MKKGLDTLKLWIEQVKNCITDAFGWFRSLTIILFRSVRKPAIFYGYDSYFFAERYKAFREKNWKCEWDQMGREQGIFPLDELRLIVCSRLELIAFQKKGLIRRNINPRKLMKKSY